MRTPKLWHLWSVRLEAGALNVLMHIQVYLVLE